MTHMKMYLLCILVGLSLLSGCSDQRNEAQDYRVVHISGVENGQNERIGLGLLLDDVTLLTSAHVIRDDRISYSIEIGGENHILSLIERDEVGDRALMKIKNGKESKNIELNSLLHISSSLKSGDGVYTLVFRSGSIIRLDGAITEPKGSVLGYTTGGQSTMLSGVVLTDLRVLPGDSGAPLFTLSGELIDVVHVMGE